MAAAKHVHKYIKDPSTKLWRCALGGKCTHHMPKNLESMLIGRASICNDCEGEFTLTVMDILMTARPICSDCKGVPKITDEMIEAVSKAAKENHSEEK